MIGATERFWREPTFASLGFERREVGCRSSAGTRYMRTIPVGMPKISSDLLDTVVYLYRDEEEAKAGKDFGGTGFLVTLPDETLPDRAVYFYAVTNWHVAVKDGFSTIRVNNTDGSVDVFEFGPEDWLFLPKYDVAIIPIPFNPSRMKAACLPSQIFVKKEMFGNNQAPLGVGSDVFMIGRFIDHDGGQTNKPAARFGHLSILPAPIIQPNKIKADSFCIDMHSRTGHSGSPVFVYRTPFSDVGYVQNVHNNAYLGLLGIHWGQFPELWEIEKGVQPKNESEAGTLILEGQYVKGLSGMACVLPAWTILEVLKMPEIVERRRKNTESVFMPKLQNDATPIAETAKSSSAAAKASPRAEDENPNHREDFNSLLNAAARTPPQDDQT
jgi:hypothetical protein